MQNIETAEAFLAALAQRDPGSMADLVTADVVQVLPLAASGSMEPAAVFNGRDAVMQVQKVIVESFSVVEFRDLQATQSADGQTVFIEAFGRRVQNNTGQVYENIYLMKFEFQDGSIHRITEYSNPVAFAQFFDQPIG